MLVSFLEWARERKYRVDIGKLLEGWVVVARWLVGSLLSGVSGYLPCN